MLTKLTVGNVTFTVGGITFTVGDNTYRHSPMCKSDATNYKFHQPSQLTSTAIQLTVTRGSTGAGGGANEFFTPVP